MRLSPLAALGFVALVGLTGCTRGANLTEPGSKARTNAKPKPRDAKAVYARMREIDGRVSTLLKAEQRHLRRQAEGTNPLAARRVLVASFERLVPIISEAEKGLKALEPGPPETRPLLKLRVRQAQGTRVLLQGSIAAAKKGDEREFRRLEARSGVEDDALQRQMKVAEATLRKRLKLKDASSPSAPTAKQKAMIADLPKGTAARDRAFVTYLRALVSMIKTQQRESSLAIGETAANLPRDSSKRDAYVRSELKRWRERDLATLAKLRALGRPPAAAEPYVRANERAVRASADEFTRILSLGKSAEGMIRELQSVQSSSGAMERDQAIGRGMEIMRAHADRIKARGTVPTALWDKLEE